MFRSRQSPLGYDVSTEQTQYGEIGDLSKGDFWKKTLDVSPVKVTGI